MRDLQRQRATAENLKLLRRFDRELPLFFLLVDAAQILECLNLEARTLSQSREQLFGPVEQAST